MTNDAMQRVVPGVFATAEQAEAAIGALRELGFDNDDLGDAVSDLAHHLMDKSDAEMLHGLAIGAAIGTPVGVLVGIGLVFLTVPGLVALGVGGLLVGVYLGGGFGVYLGSMLGLAAKMHRVTAIERQYTIALDGSNVQIVVLAGRQATAVRRIMEQYGATRMAAALA